MKPTHDQSRRGFLKATGFVARSFAIPLADASAQAPAPAKPRLPGSLNIHRQLKVRLRINADGTVTLLVGKVELGQGILTAVAQIFADELDVDFDRIRIISGDTAQVPDEGVTAGSFSMPNCVPAVQQASAEVRALLVEMASARLGVPAGTLKVVDGNIAAADRKAVSYWQLASGLSLEREATYYRPYQMHASIGTSAAIAVMGSDGVLTIDTHSQSVFQTGQAIARMLGMEVAKVRCRHVQGSGCYGHNGADDAAADAALLAVAVPGRPVKLQYTREQEHRWEPYGSAMLIKAKAGVDAQGNVLDWDLDIYSTPHGTRPSGQPGNLLSARYLEKPFAMPVPVNGGPPHLAADRNGIALYEFPSHQVRTHFITEMPLRVSSTRGLGAYANVFAIESFMDELAVAAGVDPVAYRMRVLKDPRARDVVQKAAEAFGWGQWKKRAGFGRGIGLARYKNLAGYCAVALEVQVNRRNGRIRVVRAVASADSGHLVSPDGVVNQIEGGLIQSLSWTLKEEVKFDDTRVTSDDWAGYPILTFAETPPVEVVLIDRPGEPYLGTGEASQGPTGAALANAVFDATGVRFRRLPLTPDRVKAGLG